MSFKIWHYLNMFWIIVFLTAETFILLRKVDATGVIQTPVIRILTSIILICFFAIIAIIQFVIWLFIKKNKKTH